jgi:hypothetical protein
LNGVKHQCKDPKHPILHYFEDKDEHGGSKGRCECKQSMEQPSKSLRGPTQEWGSCKWSH